MPVAESRGGCSSQDSRAVRVLRCALVAGDYIKDKYDGATEVRINKRGRLQIRDPRFSKPTANDLVYIDESPNYCVRNMSVGSLGKTS